MRLAARGLPLDYTVFFQTLDVQKALRRKLSRIGGCFATALDGCFGSEDAALREPYSNNTGSRGVLFYEQDRVDAFVREANRAGLQVALHAIGDAAVEQAVHAFEAALADFPRTDHRHIVIHADLIPEPLLDRAARLGLCLAVQPAFLDWRQEPMEYLERILGDRADSLIPLKSMLDRGLTVAAGSDAPCTLPDPLAGIHAACNHPNPAERISVLDALRMHTSLAARLSFDEGKRGTLTEGKLADFVVLDANPLETPAERLRDIGVTGLYLKGKPFERKIRGPLDLLLGALGGKG
jgi:predicted amidohydrolase YtcJ